MAQIKILLFTLLLLLSLSGLAAVTIRNIILQGNKRTRTEVFNRGLYLAPGDTLTAAELSQKLRLSTLLLAESRYFDSLSVTSAPVEEEMADVLVKVHEKQGWEISGDRSGPILRRGNLGGRGINLNVQMGYYQGAELRWWNEPNMLRLNHIWKGYLLEHDTWHKKYTLETTDLTLQYGWQNLAVDRLTLAADFFYRQPQSQEKALDRLYPYWNRWEQEYSVKVEMDHRLPRREPMEGWYAGVRTAWVQPYQRGYIRADALYYLPQSETVYTVAMLGAGLTQKRLPPWYQTPVDKIVNWRIKFEKDRSAGDYLGAKLEQRWRWLVRQNRAFNQEVSWFMESALFADAVQTGSPFGMDRYTSTAWGSFTRLHFARPLPVDFMGGMSINRGKPGWYAEIAYYW